MVTVPHITKPVGRRLWWQQSGVVWCWLEHDSVGGRGGKGREDWSTGGTK